jgi:ubiquinone/menaquinone biosynthesis C-methylase UbiE
LEYLKRKGEDISYVIGKVKLAYPNYNWNYYKTIENLKKQRTLALTRFALDYSRGKNENRYINTKLPKLPFEDKSFDLVLSGHFLFTYANKFDFEFHKASLLELFRICAKEVRIYPIQQRMLQSYPNMKKLISVFHEHDIKYEILPVPFEFQKGSNNLLRLLR